jgi:hypothetical protein
MIPRHPYPHLTEYGDCQVMQWNRGKPSAMWAVTRSIRPKMDNRWIAACPTREAAEAAARLLAEP